MTVTQSRSKDRRAFQVIQQGGSPQDRVQILQVNKARYVVLASSRPYYINRDRPRSLATVIDVGNENWITEDWIRQKLENYRSADDVFCDEFLDGVILIGGTTLLTISRDASHYLKSLGTTWVEISDLHAAAPTPGPGPYLASGGQLLEVHRLYDDTQGAFIAGIVPGTGASNDQLNVGGHLIQTLSVAVPSRLRESASDERPFAGLRIAVKDNFSIQGIKRSLCNRAFYELYPAAQQTAECIKLLSQRGAIVVGTTKLASFAATEEPLECIDFQAPWNPRADGYQSPAGSSSGSGVAIASYPWLDIAIGSDSELSG
ncbi:MAG: hypothetical protein Q9225_006711 [Loekoesia sp. 1 TL-2023]